MDIIALVVAIAALGIAGAALGLAAYGASKGQE